MTSDSRSGAPVRHLGSYSLGALLGSGGMGDVYRAHDTRLGRDVAIKILPARFTNDTERLARFDREARLLATLNHPHIAAIYGIEESDGIRGLVLELVEGETLAERIGQPSRRLPLAEALAIARQIADALEAAHEKGIVHRDLKPANVKVTPGGEVKVLDFGLAKACSGDDSAPGVTNALTSPLGATLEGSILGTAAYMSPEQARGMPVDKRTDVWAFGCLLYEMLTGRRAFAGGTAADAIAMILQREPDWATLPQSTPPLVLRLVQRCLQKDPRRRTHDIADARIEIDEAIAGLGAARPEVAPAAAARPWLRLGAGVLIGGASLLAWSFGRGTTAAAPPSTVSFERITDFVGMEESPAMSPDGKAVAFVARAGPYKQIWVRLLAGGLPLQVTRDDADHEQPRWAPDSSSLLYFSPSSVPGQQGTLWEVSMLGGTPRRIVTAASGGDISHDGRRIAAFQLGGDGRVALAVIERDQSMVDSSIAVPLEALGKNPRWSPDDQSIAFSTSSFVGFDDGLFVVRSNGKDLRQITHGDTISGVSWLPDGNGLAYSSSSGSTVLYPPIFNLRVILTDGAGGRQLTFGDVSYTEPDVHASGRVLSTRTRIQSDIWRYPIDGPADANTRKGVRITRQTGQVQTPSVSPDGRNVVYLSDSGGHGNLWVAAVDGSNARQITFEHDPGVVLGVPVWSPDGSRIVFIRSYAGVTGEWLVNPDGSGTRQVVARGVSAAWSGDGKWLYYTVSRDGDSCIEKMLVDEAKAVTIRCGRAIAPSVGADGSTLYFSIRMNGASGWDYEVRRAQPESGAFTALARVVSTRIPYDAKLFTPVLTPDGRWLAFPLTDRGTSDVWLLPTAGGPLRRVTDFGGRATLIVRRVSLSPDGSGLYAAVAETDADIVLVDHVLR